MKAAIIIVVIVVSSIGAVFYLLTYDNVTVSGRAAVTFVPGTIIQTIEFTDIQTGASTAYQFNQNSSGAGTYSVTLKNGHTYNVYISFCVINPENSQTHFTTTFYVNATAGQTAITKNFAYPNLP
jgi:CRISPR/Cas system type I-B associated protein Csh2 (Cas7 group RAMP superfamily)